MGFVRARFDTRRRRGRQTKSITVLSNDPKNDYIILRLTGVISNQTLEKPSVRSK